jgi:hypothetical protein
MYWIIKSENGDISYTTEADFRAAVNDPKQQFVSVTLPDGTVLDEASAKARFGGIGVGGAGEIEI